MSDVLGRPLADRSRREYARNVRERYVKLLPPLDETDPAERLNAYLPSPGHQRVTRHRRAATLTQCVKERH